MVSLSLSDILPCGALTLGCSAGLAPCQPEYSSPANAGGVAHHLTLPVVSVVAVNPEKVEERKPAASLDNVDHARPRIPWKFTRAGRFSIHEPSL